MSEATLSLEAVRQLICRQQKKSRVCAAPEKRHGRAMIASTAATAGWRAAELRVRDEWQRQTTLEVTLPRDPGVALPS
jgi:hypothetical protein